MHFACCIDEESELQKGCGAGPVMPKGDRRAKERALFPRGPVRLSEDTQALLLCPGLRLCLCSSLPLVCSPANTCSFLGFASVSGISLSLTTYRRTKGKQDKGMQSPRLPGVALGLGLGGAQERTELISWRTQEGRRHLSVRMERSLVTSLSGAGQPLPLLPSCQVRRL
ncbi:uncharacterized protein [Vicugna pacos]|uniref:Uncharacterized protein isoform X1 n=1 Tax=Vicugna pacos TaxID=30538 RepID=A0ABM5DI30_VICPA